MSPKIPTPKPRAIPASATKAPAPTKIAPDPRNKFLAKGTAKTRIHGGTR